MVFFVAAVLIAAVTGSVYNATQHVPEFYTEALYVEPTTAHESGEILEEQVFAFTNQVKKPRAWSLRLTDQQINGWLAADLKEKFPELLPEHIEEPRIKVKGKTLLVGCKYKGQSLNSVLAVSLDCFLVEGEPNVVGIQLHNVTAGALPIPLGQLLSEIDTYAGKADIPIRWQQKDGDPVALVTIPSSGADIEGEIRIDALQLKDGEILLSGETIKTEEEIKKEEAAPAQAPAELPSLPETPAEL
ncbi:hypothetical protein ACYFX5_22135 [Bremerella sp. T1]|uniref:hypothetical protein n=1 Tax=Bremerella sp. TYQ1 TaxID=3119568 RepID=UPI001CCD7110|nr:hypothetical protein [Bremerella volcania]UBM35739.1 hypothetical protein LA756_24075 [Bremerella volcania]